MTEGEDCRVTFMVPGLMMETLIVSYSKGRKIFLWIEEASSLPTVSPLTYLLESEQLSLSLIHYLHLAI